MNIYNAVKEMRKISENGGVFSIAYMTFSEKRQKSDGIREVKKARLIKKPAGENSDFMLSFVDTENGESRRLYQPLLMFFNGQKLKLT